MKQEIREIAYKVKDAIYEHSQQSYHDWYSCGDIEEYDSYVSFEVHVHNDKWEGDDWTEDWYVRDDGSICSPDKVWKNIDEFLMDWL